MPNELLIKIFGDSDADRKYLQSLARTCRHFYELLGRHDHVIVQSVVGHRPKAKKIILDHLAESNFEGLPLSWLFVGDRMSNTIEGILFHLEQVGALQDEKYIFRVGTTKADPFYARQMLRTVLLATQLISMQRSPQARMDFIRTRAPGLLHSFASQLRGVVEFLASKAYLFVRDLDATMTGTDEVDYPLSQPMFVRFRIALVDATYILGPSLLLGLFRMKHQFATGKLFLKYLHGIILEDQPPLRDARGNATDVLGKLFNPLARAHMHTWMHQPDTLGIKHHRGLDLSKWSAAVPDDEAWNQKMDDWGWTRPNRPVRELLRLLPRDPHRSCIPKVVFENAGSR